MLPILLALASAVAYGVSDFLAGVQSRRRHFLVVGAVAQTFSTVGMVSVALAQGVAPSRDALLWGTVASIGHVAGTLVLMRGLAAGAMHVAAPLSAVCAGAVPVVLGIALGERPSPLATLGILLALPAVYAVAAGESAEPDAHDAVARAAARRAGVRDGLLAGLGFSVFYVTMARVDGSSGAWPIAWCQVVALVAMWVIVAVQRAAAGGWAVIRAALPAWSVGATGCLGGLSYFLAGQAGGGRLTLVPVVSALYPAVTVLLAMGVLSERASRTQVLGLLGCAGAVALIAAS